MRINTVLMFAAMVAWAQPSRAEDTREAAPRTEVERDFILNEMRLFLTSLQAITTGLATSDMPAVAAEAAARGRKFAPPRQIPPGMTAKETPAWGALMSAARNGFDGITEAARSGAPPMTVVGLMGSTMASCVGCHQTYRLTAQ